MRAKKFLAMAIALGLAVGATVMPTLAADKKTFVFCGLISASSFSALKVVSPNTNVFFSAASVGIAVAPTASPRAIAIAINFFVLISWTGSTDSHG